MNRRSTRDRHDGMTVQGWFNAIVVVLAALICVGAVSAAVSLDRTRTATDELTEKLSPAKAAAYQLQASLLNQETGVRGYALTGDTSFLDPYNEGLQRQQQASALLQNLLGDSPELLNDLDGIEQTAARWRNEFAEPLLASDPDVARPDPAVYGRGKAEFDDLRDRFATQNEHLEQARTQALDHLASSRDMRRIVLTTMFVILLAATLAFAVLIRVSVISPLERVAQSSRLVAGGNFGHRIDAGKGPADIRDLAEDIEEMRRRIVSELELVRDRQAQLEAQTARLDAQAVELRRSNAELEQFAYVTSHDLQEPLRKVASFCQLLEKRYGDVLDDRGRQYIDFAVDGAKRMQALINDLLAFSRVGRVTDRFDRLSLRQPLDKALANLTAAVDDSGAVIHVPESLPEVEGDPMLLTMLWQNLVGNALKFSRPDEPPTVTIHAESDGDGMWSISVQDNGIGISPEFAEKIFVIFQRLHARDEYTGTGIGLALCKKIVEYHGGRIWLDTTGAGGARFCFTLPAIDGADNDISALSEGARQ